MAEREGFEPSIRVDPGYRIPRPREVGAGRGAEGHFVFEVRGLKAPRGRRGNRRWTQRWGTAVRQRSSLTSAYQAIVYPADRSHAAVAALGRHRRLPRESRGQGEATAGRWLARSGVSP